jgi:hypothetical protein
VVGVAGAALDRLVMEAQIVFSQKVDGGSESELESLAAMFREISVKTLPQGAK